MYWVRASLAESIIALSVQFLLIALCGWMLAKHAFSVSPKERIPVGLGLGLILFVFFSNLMGRWLPPEWGFQAALAALAVIAGLAWVTSREGFLDLEDIQVWRQLALFALLVLVFTLMGRGLGIFDDRKNLSIISLMAAGDIPPHFYMNPDFLFSYHYGFQLLGASLMRLGGLFPWSAFDLSKGIVAAGAIWLAFTYGARHDRKSGPAILFAAFLVLATGTRWLLLFLPPSLLDGLSSGINMWGSAAQTAPTFQQALSSSWVIEGGPPTPIPFAFTNGILQPFILYLQAGPRSFALMIFFTLLLIARRRKNVISSLIVIMLMAAWALTAEAEFVLFVLGIALAALFYVRARGLRLAGELRQTLGMGFLAGILSVVQGGTLTEILRGLITQTSGAFDVSYLGPDTGFGLRLPPAIVSSHLGELSLVNPGQLIVGVLEVGPLLLLAPLAFNATKDALRQGKVLLAAFGISTFFGFLLPLFFSYSVDRDVSRFTQYALIGWVVLSWPALTAAWATRGNRFRTLVSGAAFLTTFGGLVVSGSLLSAMQVAVLTDEIAPVDAAMLRSDWDRLEPDSLVLDSDPWRAVVITGRLTRSSAGSYETLASWESLRAEPMLENVLSSGYDYIYVDTYWREFNELICA